MTDLDQPATKRDLVALEAATKRDLAALSDATKRDVAALAAATKRDVAALAATTKRECVALAAATKDDLAAVEARLRRHFDVVVESFKAEFHNLYDWTHATTSTLGQRVDHLESNHGSRLLTLETRVTRLEKRRK